MSGIQKRIRLVQLIRGFDIGGANGGSDRFGIELARALDHSRFELTVCAFFRYHTPEESYWINLLKSEDITVTFLNEHSGKNDLSTLWRGIRKLRKIILEQRVDLCHSHCQLGTVSILIMKMTGVVPHGIRTAHGWCEWAPNWVGSFLDKIFSGCLYPIMLDAEVGVSQASVDRMVGHWGTRLTKRQPVLIYNAIPLNPIKINSLASVSLAEPKVVGSVGRLSKQKGYRYLIDAVPEILREFPKIEIWLIGDGELRQELEIQSKRLGIQDHIKFLGKRNDVITLLKQIDLFVLPSIWEGLPTVIIESMSQGVPVLATDIPGTRELIIDGKTGWLVPMQDSEALAKTTIYILQNPQERLRVSQEALKIIDLFAIETIAAQYQDLYRRIGVDRV